MDDPQDQRYQAIREQVIWKLGLRITFVINFIFFVLIEILMLQKVMTSGAANDLIKPLMFGLVWGIGVLIHGHLAFNPLGRLIDRIVQGEMARESQGMELEKPKRQITRLGDDGELIEVNEAGETTPRKQKNFS
jgi:hypothetical protein